MWITKTDIIPVIVGALGTINKTMEQYVQKIPGIIDLHVIQKAALLGTVHILRKVL